jgi:hypothetical protein
MQKWEYLWIYVNDSSGAPVYIANGERLPAQTYAEALNIVGKDGWELVALCRRPLSAVLHRRTRSFV